MIGCSQPDTPEMARLPFLERHRKALLVAAIPTVLILVTVILVVFTGRAGGDSKNTQNVTHTPTPPTPQNDSFLVMTSLRWQAYLKPLLQLSTPVRVVLALQLVMILVALITIVVLLRGRWREQSSDRRPEPYVRPPRRRAVWWKSERFIVLVCIMMAFVLGVVLAVTSQNKPDPNPDPNQLVQDQGKQKSYWFKGSQEVVVPREPLPQGCIKPRALINLGNTCFMNAVLQCMSHIGLDDGLDAPSDKPVKKALVETLRAIRAGGANPLRPDAMKALLPRLIKNREEYKQEDAHEFMIRVTELIDVETENDLVPERVSQKLLLRSTTTLRCENNHESVRENRPIMTIEAAMPTTGQPLSTTHILDEHCKMEVMSGDNAYACEQCGRKVTATLHTVVRPMSDVLIVTVKRFEVVETTGAKVSAPIHPDRVLSFPPPHGDYRLRAAVVQQGKTMEGGHYFAALVRDDMPADMVMICDDSELYAKNAAELQNAYILFYTK